ncbi:MAG: hypothetical protein ACJAUS_002474 [Qipengyuania sp.]|jgi:hypothetical protein
MDLPSDLLDWLHTPALIWSILACAGAAFCALRVFEQVKCARAPRPFCTIAATTRWMFGRPAAGIDIKSIDMIRLGALVSAFAFVLLLTFSLLELLGTLGGGLKPPALWLAFIISRVALGSGLMILLAGVHRLANDRGAE